MVHDDSNAETGPDLANLAALLDRTELVLIVEGSQFDARHRKANRLIARVADPSVLAELRSALRCVLDAVRPALMTPGEPTLALFADDRQYLAALTVVGASRVRSHGLLEGDVLLAEPSRFARWLSIATGASDAE